MEEEIRRAVAAEDFLTEDIRLAKWNRFAYEIQTPLEEIEQFIVKQGIGSGCAKVDCSNELKDVMREHHPEWFV